MIDCHCHLEQPDYNSDRDAVIENCKKELKAIITCSAHTKDFDLTMDMTEKYKNFIFAAAAVHPEYVKDVSEQEIANFFEKLKQNKNRIVAVGETGLDYFWVKEPEWHKKQKELFVKFINLAKQLDKPLIIHSREAEAECVKILEEQNAKKVVMHMFGANQLTARVVQNGWFISVNAILLKSKKHNKVVRDCPLEQLLLETDAPWLAPESLGTGQKIRNTPLTIRAVAEKIAEIKKIPFETVWNACAKNAIRFFRLPI